MLFPLELSANNLIKIFVEFEQFIGKRLRARKKVSLCFYKSAKGLQLLIQTISLLVLS